MSELVAARWWYVPPHVCGDPLWIEDDAEGWPIRQVERRGERLWLSSWPGGTLGDQPLLADQAAELQARGELCERTASAFERAWRAGLEERRDAWSAAQAHAPTGSTVEVCDGVFYPHGVVVTLADLGFAGLIAEPDYRRAFAARLADQAPYVPTWAQRAVIAGADDRMQWFRLALP